MAGEPVVIRVGAGPVEDYALEVAEALGAGAESVRLEAYGDAVCNAVDVALESSRRFNLEVESVEIGRRRRGGKRRIWIRISLCRRPRVGDGAPTR